MARVRWAGSANDERDEKDEAKNIAGHDECPP